MTRQRLDGSQCAGTVGGGRPCHHMVRRHRVERRERR
jgi:hypothetical protein